jgi:hypothetical protein
MTRRLSISSGFVEKSGMAEKAKEFVATGSEIYQGNVPAGAKHNH